jgi:nucleoid DNA-binding protein
VLTKNDIAREVEADTGLKPNLVKRVIDSIADIAADEISQGNDFTLPGLVRISYRYTAPRKKGESYRKGETYVGFGGVEQTAEADSKARAAKIKLVATPATPVKKHMPKSSDQAAQSAFLKSKVGKAIAKRKS